MNVTLGIGDGGDSMGMWYIFIIRAEHQQNSSVVLLNVPERLQSF